MEPLRVTASAILPAPPGQVYAILADYREGHPRILPKPYFAWLEVEKGGIGAGTRIRFQMKVLGRTQIFRAAITEPEPGRVLTETHQPGGAVTTFTVLPFEKGRQAHVTIATVMNVRAGVFGALERLITAVTLRRVYAQELKLLGDLAEQRFHAMF